MGGYAEVGQDAVHAVVAQISDVVVDEPEIGPYSRCPAVLRGIDYGFRVLVKCNQPEIILVSFRPERRRRSRP